MNAFSQNKKLSEEAIKKPIHNTKNNIYGNVIRYPFISKLPVSVALAAENIERH